MWFLIPIPRIRRRRIIYRRCNTKRTYQPRKQHHIYRDVPFILGFLCGIASIISTIGALNSHWRYYTENGVLYRINDNATQQQWFGIGAVAALLAGGLLLKLALTPKNEPSELPRSYRFGKALGSLVGIILNAIAIIGLIAGGLASLAAVAAVFAALKHETSWKIPVVALAIAATLPASMWLYNRTYIRDEPRPPSPKPPQTPPPDDGPLNPRMYYSDRR